VKRALGCEDLFDLQFLRAARFSPDGKQVAYGVSRTDDTERFDIWILELASGERARLAFDGNAVEPRWAPDGRAIAFIGDGRLRIASASNTERLPNAGFRISDALTPSTSSVQGTPCWSPDGTCIAVSLQERRISAGPRVIAGRYFRADGIGFLGGITQQIYELNVASGRLRCLTSLAEICSHPQWSPRGDQILFFAGNGAVPYASYSQRLVTVHLADGHVAEVLGTDWYVEAARWLPESRSITVLAARQSTLTIPAASLWMIDEPGAEPRLRTPELNATIGFRINHDMPVRDLTGNQALVVPDRTSALLTVQKGGYTEIWRAALVGDTAFEPIMTGDRSYIVLDASRSANVLLVAATDFNTPPELFSANLQGQRVSCLTRLNDLTLERWPKPTVRRLTFSSADSMEIDAWFMAPDGCARALPTILFIHGGPFAATGCAFRFDFHHLVSQGYGVLFANFRGSAGYGEAFARAIMGDWGGKGFPDHMGALDAAIEHGCADPQRLGVWGPSHGGFATCWLVGHTHRFKAAVAEAACTDFTTLYYQTDAPEVFARDLGGRPHEIPEIYRARSPMTYAHHCRTPTLLVHGEEDLRCPIGEAEQFHRALLDVGCATGLVRIPGCSHSGDAVGPLSARRAQNDALVSWFKLYL
jgi:dipeptidyl aminopeptidase/acylaminoacyl peptidase